MNVESSGNDPQNAASDTLESPAAPPVKRMRIGSERDQTAETAPKPNPVTPLSSPPPAQPAPKKLAPKHYPPPNIRDQLSPELEAEYEAALSDLSFDALMNQAAAGEVAVEIVPESRIKGRVARVHREDVFIDLGGRNQGVVSLRQFETPPKEGDEFAFLDIEIDAADGLDLAIFAVEEPAQCGPEAFFLLINSVRLLQAADFDNRHKRVIIRGSTACGQRHGQRPWCVRYWPKYFSRDDTARYVDPITT